MRLANACSRCGTDLRQPHGSCSANKTAFLHCPGLVSVHNQPRRALARALSLLPSFSMSEQVTWDNFTTTASHLSANTINRIAGEVLVISHNWGADWVDELNAGGVKVQNEPSFHLAVTLARLSSFEPSIPTLLTSLPAFNAHQAAQAPIAGKRLDLLTPSLFGTAEQRVTCTSSKVLEQLLDFLKSKLDPLPSAVTSRQRRAADREAKRKKPASQRNTPSPHHSRRRRPPRSLEVGRSQATAPRESVGYGPEELSAFADSALEDSGVAISNAHDQEFSLTHDQALTLTLSSPSLAATMGEDLSHLLEDPLWAQITGLLSQARQQGANLKAKAAAAKGALDQAKAHDVQARSTAKAVLSLDGDVTVALLEGAMAILEEDLKAEEALRAWKTKNRAEFLRLASRAKSAANEVDALDTSAGDEAIAELEASIEAYQTECDALKTAEDAVVEAEEACGQACDAVAADRRRRKTFQDLANGVGSNLLFKEVDAALARHRDDQGLV